MNGHFKRRMEMLNPAIILQGNIWQGQLIDYETRLGLSLKQKITKIRYLINENLTDSLLEG